jgi:hypothetical protein
MRLAVAFVGADVVGVRLFCGQKHAAWPRPVRYTCYKVTLIKTTECEGQAECLPRVGNVPHVQLAVSHTAQLGSKG